MALDQKLFKQTIEALQKFRDEDNEDYITLTRNEVIIILEGIKRNVVLS